MNIQRYIVGSQAYEETEKLQGSLDTLGAYANNECPPEEALQAIREVKGSMLGNAVSSFFGKVMNGAGERTCEAAADVLLKGGLERALCFKPVTMRVAEGAVNMAREHAGMAPIQKTIPSSREVELQEARTLGKLVNVAKERIQQKAVSGIS